MILDFRGFIKVWEKLDKFWIDIERLRESWIDIKRLEEFWVDVERILDRYGKNFGEID